MAQGIVLEDVSFAHPGVAVLSGASLEIPAGGTCVVTGANGSGKSTLLYVAAGLVAPDAGVVRLGGEDARSPYPSDLMRRGVRRGFVFQEGGLLSNMSALSNVTLALRYHAELYGLDDREIEARARRALERVGFGPSDLQALPAHLSFGLRKRLALARAIAVEPTFFFFDDPDVGLDARTAALVHEILCELRDDPAVTVMVATNRDILVDRLGVPGWVLQGGRLVERRAAPLSSSRRA